MTKILRSSTIIDSSLYVHRDADRQLKQCLSDMGRPAYVLVARQMGKTNLLLNARRELKRDQDVFVYLDLSNAASSSRECFQSIIDTAIETDDRFSEAATDIAGIRARQLAPQREHDLELRRLLKSIPGKLVVILDEVDALTNTPFSDQLFAQIRSTYFLRANVADYERLTYILSGVAEPGELIKNPKLSPFNIGEKIYLDDFTEDEFDDFVKRARLNFNDKIKAEVYQWLRGNPRMTWDVCSELEELQNNGHKLESGVVERSIEKLYLTAFDRAPIDHIRSIAEANADIRNALVEIRYGKGDVVSDGTRNKLYLAGITSSRRDALKIKNPVIDKALSEQWLKGIERQKRTLLAIASDQLTQQRYGEAIETYLECLEQAALDSVDKATAYDGLSRAEYALGNYAKAAEHAELGLFDRSNFPGLYIEQRYRQGSCYFLLQRYAESINLFTEVIEQSQDQYLRIQASTNRASAYLRTDAQAHRDEIVASYEDAVSKILENDAEISKQAGPALITSVRFNLAQAYREFGELNSAIHQLELTQDSASLPEKPTLLFALSALVEDEEKSRSLCKESVRVIIDNKLAPPTSPKDHRLELTESTILGLITSTLTQDDNTFEELLGYCLPWATQQERFLGKLAATIVNSGIAHIDRALKVSRTDYHFAKLLSIFALRKSISSTATIVYVHALAAERRQLDPGDTWILGRLIVQSLEQGDIDESRRLLDVIAPHRALTPASLLIAIDYYALVMAEFDGDPVDQQRIAQELIATTDGDHDWPISPAFLEEVRKRSADVLRRAKESQLPKVGRNQRIKVRYDDGRVVEKKFKHVEEDLRLGKCRLTT